MSSDDPLVKNLKRGALYQHKFWPDRGNQFYVPTIPEQIAQGYEADEMVRKRILSKGKVSWERWERWEGDVYNGDYILASWPCYDCKTLIDMEHFLCEECQKKNIAEAEASAI
jgi:hypothetical protein